MKILPAADRKLRLMDAATAQTLLCLMQLAIKPKLLKKGVNK